MRWLYRQIRGRRPWIAVLAALLLGPILAMLYMNRGRLALLYLASVIATLCAGFFALLAVPQLEGAVSLIIDVFSIGLIVVGTIHAFILARNFHDTQLRWFARCMPPLLLCMITFVIIAIPFRTFFYEPFNVPSQSMMPTISVGDTFFAKKFAYGYSRYALPFNIPIFKGKIMKQEPKRGDIVIFDRKDMPHISFVKRIVGMPHDTIQMIDGKLYINGEEVPRTLINITEFAADRFDVYEETLDNGKKYRIWNQHGKHTHGNTPMHTVPENHYFVMGDNRSNSMDSRAMNTIGFIHEDQIIGKADILFYDGALDAIAWQHID